MRALLINPPDLHTVVANNPTVIDEERGHHPPLGILHVAGYLRAFSHHEVAICDAQVERLDFEAIRQRIIDYKPDLVGVTAMTFTILDVMEICRIAKAIDPDIVVALGGPHVHIFQTETIRLPFVDVIVIGEGETTFKDLMDHLRDPAGMRKVAGIVYKDKDGAVVNTGNRPLLDDLDILPFPARDLTPYHRYTHLMAKHQPITTMFTSRGCPYKCTFCDRPHLGKNFRARSPKSVVDEMEEIVNLGIRETLIYDDTFTINKRRVHEICDEILARGIKLGWDIRARVNTVDEELLSKMKAAGCERIHYGVEVGNDRMMKVLKKGLTISQVERGFKMTKDAGIETLAYFMIGNPSETREDIMDSVALAKRIEPDYIHLTILTPFPATEVYFEGLKQGVIKKDFWREFAKNPSADFEPEYWLENFKKEELFELLVHAYKAFYQRPSYIWRVGTRVRSVGEFMRKASAGLKIFGMNARGATRLSEI
jgi:anaerobic magnesium-protoporphyrin IX monomethyl ester cyclase